VKKRLKKTAGVVGSVFGLKLSSQIVNALSKRFPGEPLKILGKFVSTEIDVRIALAESDIKAGRWVEARKSFSKVMGMSLEEVLDEKDLKAMKQYLKEKSAERKAIALVYKNLRNRILFKI